MIYLLKMLNGVQSKGLNSQGVVLGFLRVFVKFDRIIEIPNPPFTTT